MLLAKTRAGLRRRRLGQRCCVEARQRIGYSIVRLGQLSLRLGHCSEARSAQRQALLCADSASVCADHDDHDSALTDDNWNLKQQMAKP
jgi:hypothetical protein